MKRKYLILFFVLIFILFLGLYLSDNINWLDDSLFNLIFNLRSNLMTNIMKFITFFASTKFITIIFIILLILYFINKKRIYLVTDIIILGEVVLNNIIKILVGRERPEIEHLVTENSFSFPSGHTMVAVVFYGLIIYLLNKSKINKKIKILITVFLISLIVLIMISRIYLGVHFTSDVLSGASLSLAYLIYMVDSLEKRKLL